MKHYLQKAIDYVDQHVDAPLNLDHIAAQVGFSKFYLTIHSKNSTCL